MIIKKCLEFFPSFFFFLLIFYSVSVLYKVFASNVNLTVTVGNNPPVFTVQPFETPSSDTTTPVNVGDNISFTATLTDPNVDSYYLLLCKNSNAPTPGSLSAPECNGGSSNRLCVGTITASGASTSCIHATTGEAVQSQVWYAFGCDNSTQSACSASASGSGASGSPYYINHAPTFTIAPVTPTLNPGGTAVFTVTSGSWGDADTTPTQDTGKLLVCATSGITNGVCNGTQLCASSAINPGSPLTCSYSDAVNPVKAAGTYPAYVYIVDNHNFGASGAIQGTNVGYTINNMAPTVQSVSINGGSNITLPGNTTTNINIDSTVWDNNGCLTLSATPVSLKFYRSAIGAVGCTLISSSCYLITSSSCSIDLADNCSGSTDKSVKYSCIVPLEYFTDPTDGLITTNPYYNENWLSTVTAIDLSSATGSLEGTTPVEIASTNSIEMTSAIDFGSLAPNIASGGGVINIPVTINNTGNIGLDLETKGNGAGLCTDYPTCAGASIGISQQKWEYINNTTSYSTGTHPLSSTLTSVPLHILKPLLAVHPAIKSTYWGLMVPLGQAYGAYTGQNTINSLVSAPANW